MSISGTFTATGVSAALAIGREPGAEASALVTVSGTYVAKVYLERSADPGGASWKRVATWPAVGGRTNFSISEPGIYRFRCDPYTSGTVTYSILEEEDTLYEIKDSNGKVRFRITDQNTYTADTNGDLQPIDISALTAHGLKTPFDYGAQGGGADDTVALAAWISTGKCAVPPGEFFNTTQKLSVPKNAVVLGPGGPGQGINGQSIVGDAIMQIGDGGAANTGVGLGDNAVVRGFALGGTTAAMALKIANAQALSVGDLYWVGGVTGSRTANLFFIENTWDNELGPFHTEGNLSGLMNACFYLNGVVNSTKCRAWRTSNTCNYNVYSIADAVGVTWDNLTVQGGDTGFKMQIGHGCGIRGVYSELCGIPIDLGDDLVAGRIVRGFAIDGGALEGKTTYATRAAAMELRNVYGGHFKNIQFRGLNPDTKVTLTITDANGTGALAVLRLNANNTANSVEMVNEGINYTAPTVTPSSGDATFAAVLDNGKIKSITVTSAGTAGGMPTAPGTPVAVRYTKCYRTTFYNPQVNDGKNGEMSPFFPHVTRSAAADTLSGVNIVGDASLFNSIDVADLSMRKAGRANNLYQHILEYLDGDGETVKRVYTPPVY